MQGPHYVSCIIKRGGPRKHAAQEFAFGLKLFANSTDLVFADFAGPMERHFELPPVHTFNGQADAWFRLEA
jgi:hypothetical protein